MSFNFDGNSKVFTGSGRIAEHYKTVVIRLFKLCSLYITHQPKTMEWTFIEQPTFHEINDTPQLTYHYKWNLSPVYNSCHVVRLHAARCLHKVCETK